VKAPDAVQFVQLLLLYEVTVWSAGRKKPRRAEHLSMSGAGSRRVQSAFVAETVFEMATSASSVLEIRRRLTESTDLRAAGRRSLD